MTDQTINVTVDVDLDKIREWAETFAERGEHGPAHVMFEFLKNNTPTLAGLAEDEIDKYKWAQAEVDQHGVGIITCILDDSIQFMKRNGLLITVFGKDYGKVTPRPDLPKMVWPSGDAPDQGTNSSETPKGPEPQVGEEWIEAANQASKEALEDRGYSFNEERAPQAGEAWLVENGGDHAVGFKIRDGRWVIYNPNHYKVRNPHLVTPIARLVPETQPVGDVDGVAQCTDCMVGFDGDEHGDCPDCGSVNTKWEPETPRKVLVTREDYRDVPVGTVITYPAFFDDGLL